MRLRRTSLLSLLLPAALLALAGCGATGDLLPAGHGKPAVRAQGPHRLWPDRPPAPRVPEHTAGRDAPYVVPGVRIPASGELRDVPAGEVLAADLAAEADSEPGDDPTRQLLTACAPSAEPAACPVREAHYRDLTGDGHDELILGIEQPGHSLNLRVYSLLDGRIQRIMNDTQRIISVELAARDLILWSPNPIPGTESRDVWSWSPELGVMSPRLMELVRTPQEEP
ncbi:hypothetical protein ACFXDJ_09360 [Streptomyces sp. NPDC059443]|uniref:hypothetical protein n=1 Tax=unclassified Streptomyces TaxID=2593676 RepID=UPI003689A819